MFWGFSSLEGRSEFGTLQGKTEIYDVCTQKINHILLPSNYSNRNKVVLTQHPSVFAWFLTGYQSHCSLWISIVLFTYLPEILMRRSDKNKRTFLLTLIPVHTSSYFYLPSCSRMLHCSGFCQIYFIFSWSEMFFCLCFQDAPLWLTRGSSNQQCGKVATFPFP